MQGDITSAEFLRRCKEGEAVPKDALTYQRVKTALRKLLKVKHANGLYTQVYLVVTPNVRYAEIDLRGYVERMPSDQNKEIFE